MSKTIDGISMEYEHHTLKHNGLSWHVVTHGPEDAVPVLLLHCWTGNWTMWKETIEALSGQYRFIAPDHLGFGQSDKPRGDHYQTLEQAKRARLLIDMLGYKRSHVIGHSMGGQIALHYASQYPKDVERLIVVDPVVNGRRLHPLVFTAVPFMYLARRGMEFPYHWFYRLASSFPSVGIQFARAYLPYPDRYREAALYWLHQVMADGQINASAWALKALRNCDVTPELHKIEAPTLAVWGTKDYSVPVWQCKLLEQNIPNCQAVRIPDIGHIPMLEAFDTYIQSVRTFLNREKSGAIND